MFNKKLLNVLCWVLAVMLVVQLVLNLVMWIWGYFGEVNLNAELVKVIQTIAGVGEVAFIYVIVAAVRGLIIGGKK
jgi:hypothetical protein